MKIAITKGLRDDLITIDRAAGGTVTTRFAKKGPIPHDAVHFFVEDGLGLKNGFWGLVAQGRHPEDLAELAKAHGHPSASRATRPDAAIVELLQAERLVECFEAELWGGEAEVETFVAIARTACEASHVELPALTGTNLMQVRETIALFGAQWRPAGEGYVAHLEWQMHARQG